MYVQRHGAVKLALKVSLPYTVAPYKGGSKKMSTYNRYLKGSECTEAVGRGILRCFESGESYYYFCHYGRRDVKILICCHN